VKCHYADTFMTQLKKTTGDRRLSALAHRGARPRVPDRRRRQRDFSVFKGLVLRACEATPRSNAPRRTINDGPSASRSATPAAPTRPAPATARLHDHLAVAPIPRWNARLIKIIKDLGAAHRGASRQHRRPTFIGAGARPRVTDRRRRRRDYITASRWRRSRVGTRDQ